MPPERPIDANERLILERILSFEFAGAEELRSQVGRIQVSSGCECGCATINLAVDKADSMPATNVANPLPVTGTTADKLGGVIVFQRDGWLTCMEIYTVGDDPIAMFPPVDTISFDLNSDRPSL